MIILLFLIPVSVAVAVAFLAAFIWAVRAGQYEDTCTPAMRMLAEDQPKAREFARRGLPPRAADFSPLPQGTHSTCRASNNGAELTRRPSGSNQSPGRTNQNPCQDHP